MGLFDILLGGGQKRQEYEDFARRYEQGPPWEGYSDREVLDRYGEVAHQAPPADYEAALRESLSRLSPSEQRDLLRDLQERTRTRGVTLPQPGTVAQGGGLDDLVRSVRDLHQQPGRLRDVLTGPAAGGPVGMPRSPEGSAGGTPGAGTIFANPLAKAALAGIAAMLVRRMLAPR
jgi:hypothetical protein